MCGSLQGQRLSSAAASKLYSKHGILNRRNCWPFEPSSIRQKMLLVELCSMAILSHLCEQTLNLFLILSILNLNLKALVCKRAKFSLNMNKLQIQNLICNFGTITFEECFEAISC